LIISLLLAADQSNVIGLNNQLPWHLPNDLKYFKNLTWGMPIVMGRKTFESIGKPLPGRRSIVITRNQDWNEANVEVVHSIREAVELAGASVKEIFVIGGAEIFNTVLEDASRIYLTRIHHRFEGDVYFKGIDQQHWKLSRKVDCDADEKNRYKHSFEVWERN
jgi:dihydrofolate reductase